MGDLISKTVFSGLGLASMAKEAMQKIAKDVAKNADLSEAEGRRVAKELKKQTAHLEKAIAESVETAVHKVVKKLNQVEEKLDKTSKKRSSKS
jgi:polyhydroxyalkanoate synthesis regulator phasin